MPDQVTRITRQSWGQRVKGSVGGIFIGVLLAVGALVLLFSNEGRAVRRHKALKQGSREVVSVAATTAQPANEGRLVHLSGLATTGETLTDPEFGIAVRAIHLERSVEMFQWIESSESSTEKKVGGSTETTTTYTYRRGWSNRLIDSSGFAEPAGHRNPTSMPYSSRRFSAREVTLGGFRLSDRLIQRLDRWSPVDPRSTAGIRGARLTDGGLYIGADPAAPRVGDVRVSFRRVEPAAVSVVAAQSGGVLTSYDTRAGGSIELLRYGQASAEEMFSAARRGNKVLTWILRLAGYLLMVIGLGLIMRPLSVLADVIPLIGNLVARGTGAVALGCALPVALVTISIAWLVYRPLLGLAILLPAVFLGVYALKRARQERKPAGEPTPAAPPPPPPPPPPPAPTA